MTAAEELLAWLEENRNEKNIEGMARFGIRTDRAVGVPLPPCLSSSPSIR